MNATAAHGASVRIENCGKTFADGTHALEPASLDIARGETVVLLGPSGCGKTTMLRIIAGLETPDRYTLRITLTHGDYTFGQVMALPALSAVAHEVVEAYPGDMAAHPVGTGPYALKEWVRASKMVLVANPGYRGFVWDFDPGNDPTDKAIAARMRGLHMPRIGTIDISVMEEPQSNWLAFERGELDLLNLPSTFAPVALPHGGTHEYAPADHAQRGGKIGVEESHPPAHARSDCRC